MYDAIIIGKGPAGLSASLYTARGGLKTLVIGRKSMLSAGDRIENYCCSEPISGEKLIRKGIEQAKRFGVDIEEAEVIDVRRDDGFIVYTKESEYRGKSLIIATGKVRKRISIKGIQEFEGKGVHYCVTCDGFFYTDRKVGILGYTDYAIRELMEFNGITRWVTLFTNGNRLEVDQKGLGYISENNIEVCDKPIDYLDGQDKLERIMMRNGEHREIDGLFVAYGSASSVDLARKIGILLDDDQDIIVDKKQRTNVDGVFAAGDCTGGLAQVATAVGQGASAGHYAKEYVHNIKRSYSLQL
jgi:thioredoxin reductase (NADPH)